jgi:hypothetical protein
MSDPFIQLGRAATAFATKGSASLRPNPGRGSPGENAHVSISSMVNGGCLVPSHEDKFKTQPQ